MDEKIFLCHSESDCVWTVPNRQQANKDLEDGLVVEIDEQQYNELHRENFVNKGNC